MSQDNLSTKRWIRRGWIALVLLTITGLYAFFYKPSPAELLNTVCTVVCLLVLFIFSIVLIGYVLLQLALRGTLLKFVPKGFVAYINGLIENSAQKRRDKFLAKNNLTLNEVIAPSDKVTATSMYDFLFDNPEYGPEAITLMREEQWNLYQATAILLEKKNFSNGLRRTPWSAFVDVHEKNKRSGNLHAYHKVSFEYRRGRDMGEITYLGAIESRVSLNAIPFESVETKIHPSRDYVSYTILTPAHSENEAKTLTERHFDEFRVWDLHSLSRISDWDWNE